MKTLHLTLKRQWFDMIQSGEKCEEYREIKNFWFRRLYGYSLINPLDPQDLDIYSTVIHNIDHIGNPTNHFDTVTFRHGYATDAPEMTFPIESITIGEGKPEWGAKPGKKYFVIKFGEQK